MLIEKANYKRSEVRPLNHKGILFKELYFYDTLNGRSPQENNNDLIIPFELVQKILEVLISIIAMKSNRKMQKSLIYSTLILLIFA